MRNSFRLDLLPWAFLGLSLPLFSVDLFRITMPLGLKLQPPVIFVFLIVGIGILKKFMNDGDIIEGMDDRYRFLFLTILIFWGWHFLGLARAEEFQWAAVEFVKLTVGVSIFLILVLFSAVSLEKLETSLILCLWGSAILLGFLIYKYAWIFHSPYLGISISEPTRANRNQLAWYLAVLLPYSAAYFFRGPGRLRGLIPLLVMILAWMYTSSRGSWICGGIGIAWSVGISRGTGFWEKVGRGVILAVVVVSVVLIVWVKVLPSFQLEDFDLVKRMGSLVSSQEMESDYSYGVRKELVANALERFERHPIVGSGLTNSRIQNRFVSHNDVLGIMSELGFIGIVFFGSIIGIVLWMCMNSVHGNWLKAGSQGSVLALTLYLGLINAYTTVAFWVILFFSLAIRMFSENEKSSRHMVGK